MDNSIDKFRFNKFTLTFQNTRVESDYLSYTLDRTILFYRLAWIIVIFLGSGFALLDKPLFGDNSTTVLWARGLIVLVSLSAIYISFRPKTRSLMKWSGFAFITVIGSFCIFLISLGDTSQFTPYFTGIFFAYTGIFTVSGLGFFPNLIALLINVTVFELVLGFIRPQDPIVFWVYNFFLFGMLIIFIYVGYLVEHIARQNFIVSAKLRESLNDVRTLSGLLPICSHCKNIRDDRGYWQQLETYIIEHTEADFTHGLYPNCSDDLYGSESWYEKEELS